MLGKSNSTSTSYLYIHTYLHTDPSFQVYVSKCVSGCVCARETPTHTTTLTTLRGLKIYLLFNRLVRRFVMSVNVSGVSKVKL